MPGTIKSLAWASASLQAGAKNYAMAKQSSDVNPLAGLRFRSLARGYWESILMTAKGQFTSPDQGFDGVKYPALSELVLHHFQPSKSQT